MSLFLKTGPGKSFVKWRPFSRRNPIHTLKPPAKAIMQTFLLFLAISEPSPRTLMVTGAISLVSLAIFLRHKLG
jgi:energy-coupling factor transporter transmembrane protein EcfT